MELSFGPKNKENEVELLRLLKHFATVNRMNDGAKSQQNIEETGQIQQVYSLAYALKVLSR
jgi:hypothetical protein